MQLNVYAVAEYIALTVSVLLAFCLSSSPSYIGFSSSSFLSFSSFSFSSSPPPLLQGDGQNGQQKIEREKVEEVGQGEGPFLSSFLVLVVLR